MESSSKFRRANLRTVVVNFTEQTCGQLQSISQSKLEDSCSQFRKANLRTVVVNIIEIFFFFLVSFTGEAREDASPGRFGRNKF